MTGRQHYLEAERLLDVAGKYPEGHATAHQRIAEAQVHALLARAAEGPGRQVDHEWCGSCDGSGYAPPRTPSVAA